MNAWLPQTSYPCGNVSDAASWAFLRPKGSIGHVVTACIRTENQNQSSDVDVLKLMRFLRLCSKNGKNNHVREVIQSALPFSKDLEHASANQHVQSALRMYSFLLIRLVLIFHLYWLHKLGRNHRNFKCIPDSQAGPGPLRVFQGVPSMRRSEKIWLDTSDSPVCPSNLKTVVIWCGPFRIYASHPSRMEKNAGTNVQCNLYKQNLDVAYLLADRVETSY